ncbi:LysR family transcriptional regulator [Galbibacter pacificus]|uniref:LysR family transcriptional regulator n=1 Tax=Galbibacter pacificus TaxID=2996052 RepID=A0ABT6FW04_9FLAO|nr:LysR family transcriptional regulator [Galbibacter pacificus]MDG3584120.1 LysR family transcriptional regulator [Galbibacter pacificus]MDG3587447.1 LysR family transcriptional regulator [Galbibacter pacificus]
MNINDLNIFIASAEYESLTKAALFCNTVQSNVSARIKFLENELNTKLFIRSTRQIELTPEGTDFLKVAKKITTSLSDFQRSVNGKNTNPQGSIRIGCIQTTAALRAPEVLKNFSQAYSEVGFKLKTGTTSALIKEVLSFKLDGAFVSGAIAHPDLEVCPVLYENLVLVSSPTFEDFNKKNTHKTLKIVVFSKGCSYRDLLEAVLKDMGFSRIKFIEIDTLEGIINTIESGIGLTLLPRELIEKHYPYRNLKIKTLPEKISQVPTVFIKHKDFPMSEAYSLFFKSIINGYN